MGSDLGVLDGTTYVHMGIIPYTYPLLAPVVDGHSPGTLVN